MHCCVCGNDTNKVVTLLEYRRIGLGNCKCANVTYNKCSVCDEVMLPMTTIKILESFEHAALQDKLLLQSVTAYMTHSDTATYLGMSTDALSTHTRINRGFIHSVCIQSERFYLTKSVDLFKSTGDGRYTLT